MKAGEMLAEVKTWPEKWQTAFANVLTTATWVWEGDEQEAVTHAYLLVRVRYDAARRDGK